MAKTLTVFTPTYNRANTIKRTYKSLCNQTSSDFEWLVIDDGSKDDTAELVNQWISDNKIPIRLISKENGGLHTGYNTAIKEINTELCMCCDSDDYLPNNAVELICKTWREKGRSDLAGIIGLDFYANKQKPIGGYFSDTNYNYHFLELASKLKHYGDMKMVHRTEILKPHIPMPTFENEKNFNPIYIFLEVDPNLKYILINENLCYVDYQENGMSANILRQFRNSPRSFAQLRKVRLTHPLISNRRKLIDAAHLTSSAFLSRDKSILFRVLRNWRCWLTLPLGVAFYIYIISKTSK